MSNKTWLVLIIIIVLVAVLVGKFFVFNNQTVDIETTGQALQNNMKINMKIESDISPTTAISQ